MKKSAGAARSCIDFWPRTRSRIAPWSGLEADEQSPRVKTETEKANALWHESKMVADLQEVKSCAARLITMRRQRARSDKKVERSGRSCAHMHEQRLGAIWLLYRFML